MSELHDAVMASWAAYYENGLDLQSPHPEALGYKDIVWLPGKRGFCGVKDGKFVASIAGTRSPGDVVTDARIGQKAILTPCGAMSVHAGFLADAEEVQRVLFEALDAALKKDPNLSVLLTGHSLGASVAGLISRMDFRPVTLITFGSPRTGNELFAVTPPWVTKSIRVVHDHDLIPTIPLSCERLKLTYEHCGVLLHLAPDGSKLRWYHRLFRRLIKDLPLISDHPVHKYAAAVKAYEAA